MLTHHHHKRLALEVRHSDTRTVDASRAEIVQAHLSAGGTVHGHAVRRDEKPQGGNGEQHEDAGVVSLLVGQGYRNPRHTWG